MSVSEEEQDGLPSHPGNWSTKQFSFTPRKLIPKTVQRVSVSVIEAELHSKIMYECV